jgi:hypothetical protein
MLFTNNNGQQNLAYFVKTHEKALANALHQHQRQNSRAGPESGSQSVSSPITSYSPSSTSSLSSSFPYLGFGSRNVKPAKLTLTPHHLFYLLSRFQELGVSVGPMDVRLENIHTGAAPGEYVSFLNQAQRKRIRGGDRDSIHSVSSIRSVMSTMSSLWTRLGLSGRSEAKTEKLKLQIKEDLTYLYSAFTKVPCLRLSPDHKAPLISGYEEFPFDSAVPLVAFKNVTSLEICDVDFRQFYGWDRMAEQLRSLTIKRGHLDDPSDLLLNIVLDDMDKRRRRSAKIPPSPILPWSAPSPVMKQAELATSVSKNSPPVRPASMGGSTILIPGKITHHNRQRSLSPTRPSSSRNGSTQAPTRISTPNLRRSSGSSDSTDRANTPRGSSSNLLSFCHFPSHKWRFLRHLSLADNGLTTVSAAGLAPLASTLQYLDLSSNLITEIPDGLSSLVALRALNLSHCMINSLHSLTKSPLPAITVLNLRGNRLTSLAGIEKLFSLERLDVRENRLTDPTEIARLTGIPNICDLYVNRNPFVKTHLNYRLTIFNLFRETPGYTEDIVLDGQGPSYSERKVLVDRAPEPANLPVIPPAPTPEEPKVERPRPRVFASEPIILHDPFTNTRIATLPYKKSQRTSQRRKKMSRRRVVEIAHEENTSIGVPIPADVAGDLLKNHSTTDDSTYGGSVDATIRKTSIDDIVRDEEITFSPTPAANEEELVNEPVFTTSEETSKPLPSLPQLPSDSELYKKRIETLRNDFGSAWLSALTDETWDNQALSSVPAFDTAYSPLAPPAPVRSASQGIVSTGRTIG